MEIPSKSRIFVSKNVIIMRHNFKTIIIVATWLLSLSVYAQDIIVTTDAQKIEAKITEVSKSEIRYKEKDYPDGPIFVLSTDEIVSIIYANGKVVLYNSSDTGKEATAIDIANDESEPQETVDESIADIHLTSGQTIRAHIIALKSDEVTYMTDDKQMTISAVEIEKVTFLHNGQTRYYSQEAITRHFEAKKSKHEEIHKNKELNDEESIIYTAAEFHGTTLPKFTYTKVNVPGKKYKKKRYIGGNMILTAGEFEKLLKDYCPEAYAYHQKANTFLILECISILLGVIPVVIFGVLCISNSSMVLPTYNKMCAGQQTALDNISPQHNFHDNVQLARVVRQ